MRIKSYFVFSTLQKSNFGIEISSNFSYFPLTISTLISRKILNDLFTSIEFVQTVESFWKKTNIFSLGHPVFSHRVSDHQSSERLPKANSTFLAPPQSLNESKLLFKQTTNVPKIMGFPQKNIIWGILSEKTKCCSGRKFRIFLPFHETISFSWYFNLVFIFSYLAGVFF